jgi:hypothetical protein
LTRSRNRAISWSLAVGSVVISGGGVAAFLAALLLVLLMVVRVRLGIAAKRCGGWVRRPRLPLRLFCVPIRQF